MAVLNCLVWWLWIPSGPKQPAVQQGHLVNTWIVLCTSEEPVKGLVKPCNIMESKGQQRPTWLPLSTVIPQNVPPQAWGPRAAATPCPTLRKHKTGNFIFGLIFWKFLKKKKKKKMRWLLKSCLECNWTDHKVYFQDSVFLRFANVVKRPCIQNHEIFCIT